MSNKHEDGRTSQVHEWLIGGGHMGEFIRSKDWSTTPLGPRERWPVTLRTVVSLVVGNQFPMAVLWGADLLLLYNDAYRQIAADRHPSAMGRSTREVWPEVWPINAPIFAAVMERGETVYLEDKPFPINRNGQREEPTFTLCYSPVRAEDGSVAGTLVTLLEMTQRIRQRQSLEADRARAQADAAREHEELRATESRYQALFADIDVGFCITQAIFNDAGQVVNYRFLQTNPAFLRHSGVSDAEGKTVLDLVPSLEPGWFERYGRVAITGQPLRFEQETPALGRWFDVYAFRTGNPEERKVAMIFSDITARRLAEQQIRHQASRLRVMFENVALGIAEVGPSALIERVNGRLAQLLGYEPNELVGKSIHDLTAPEDVERSNDLNGKLLRGELDTFEYEKRYLRKNGTRVWVHVTVSSIRGVKGAVVGAVGTVEDITERKQVEEELERERTLLEGIFDNIPVLLVRWDPRLKRFVLNRRAEEVLGWSTDEANTGDLMSKVYPDPQYRAQVVAYMQSLQPGFHEWLVTTKTGERVPIDWANLRLRHDTSIGIGVDLRDRKRAETALRRSEERLRLAQQAARIGTFEYYPQSNTSQWSPELEALYGLPLGAFDGTYQHWARLVHPEDLPRVERSLREALKTGILEADWRVITPGGTIRWLAGRAQVFRDAEGKPVLMLGVNVDITELRNRERDFRTLIENLHSGVALIDHAGRFSLFNSRFLELFGLGPADIENVNSRNWSAWQVFDESGRLLDPDDHPVRKAARTLDVVRDQTVAVRLPDGGGLRWMQVSAAPLRGSGDSFEKVICTYHDITDLKRAEEALRRSEENARASEADMKKAQEEQQRLLQALREADQQKNAFLAVLSHELRNPLTPIGNSIYILERTRPGGEQAKHALTVIDRQVNQMTRLIDDLLDVTRISRGKIRLRRENIDLCEVVRSTGEDLRAIFAAGGIRLDLAIPERPVPVYADRTRVAQIVGNLLQNAAKFTPSGERVRLSVERDDAHRAVIRVQDTGVGIEPHLIDKLFQPFVQAEKTLERTKGGLGLGLALVKGLVDLHGGTVTAHSEGPGTGAEFSIELPTSDRPDLERRSGPRAEGCTGEDLRVLLIEDNLDAAESLKEVLELNGHQVETAANGMEGIEKARVFQPDVVLCDIGLPGIDGFEVARRMRRDPVLRSTCLVALSGYASPEDVERSRAAGFVQHLAKPPDLGVLESTLHKTCDHRARAH